MRLLLSMLAWPDGAKPEVRDTDTDLAIGRGVECGWVLTDVNQQLSRLHCLLVRAGDVWKVTDKSKNGTFINDGALPIGQERTQVLHDGDQIHIGAYVIEARYDSSSAFWGTSLANANDPSAPDGRLRAASSDSWQPETWEPWPASQQGSFASSGHLDPDHFVGAPMSDHSAPFTDVWVPPPSGPVMIPVDFDFTSASPADSSVTPRAQVATPGVRNASLAEGLGSGAPVRPASAPPLSLASTGVPVSVAAPSDEGLLAAFQRGAGLPNLGSNDPAAMMESLGAALRIAVDRLRAVQIDRAAIRREFRILGTGAQAADNNPIKFSASTDAALQALLTGSRPPSQVLGEVLDEVRLHELAMIGAMRDAVRELLGSLAPARIRSAAEEHGLTGILSVQRKARAFDRYEALHARTVQALTDNFDSVFGRAFALAYERVTLDDDNDLGSRGR